MNETGVRCARDSDWCDGYICRDHGIDCPNAEPLVNEYRAPDYSDYEFSWEPGRVFVRWSLTRRDRRGKPEGMGPLARGRAFTLSKARTDAFAAMASDAFAANLPHTPRVEDGNELMRKAGKDPRDPTQPERRG